ncbi:MAG TPA: TIGR02266 family protein, partial [Thermoanaerobaculia bacterium]|nr:TIGR02266 family protein [Thermoanaerobaculia bacterium]
DLERRRVPLERKISLKFKEFRGFITEYSANLSMGGMFIRTTSPKPIGTIFDFELSLTDDFKLVQGIGEVLWVRDADDGPERPSGMGVRFLDLSSESRRLIQRIVEEQVAHGGTPFELEPPGFPPPPLRTTPPPSQGRQGAQSTLFHATAAPLAPSPPLPPRRAAAARAQGSAPVPPSVPPPRPTAPVTPPRSAAAAAPQPRARPAAPPPAAADFDSFPDLGPPELPIPELFAPEGSGDVLPDVDLLESEPLEGLPLVDAQEEPGAPFDAPLTIPLLPPDLDEDATLTRHHHSADAQPMGVEQPSAPQPWTTGPAPHHLPMAAPAGARAARIPSGFDEVARAFSEPRSFGEPQGETRRMTPLEVPPEIARPTAAAPPSPSPPQAEPVAAAPPLAVPARRPAKRRRSWATLAVAAAFVLLLGGFAVLYLQFPELLPEWAGGVRPGDSTTALPPFAPGGGAAVRQQAPPPPVVASAAIAPEAAPAPSATPSTAAGSTAPATAPSLPPSAAAAAAPPDREAAARAALGGDAPRARFTSVEEIWGQRSPLGTVITIVTNGSVPADAFSHFRLEGANPREVIRLRGVDASYRRSSVPVSTAEVKQVRLGYHSEGDRNELHVVLDLASPRVQLLRSTPIDNRLELLLAAQ